MVDFDIGDHSYRAEKLNAIDQFHLSRKVAPLIPPLIPVFAAVGRSQDVRDNLDSIAPMLQPFADGLAAMTDEASEAIFALCLSAVKRKDGDRWFAIWDKDSHSLRYDDINDMGILLKMVMTVIQDSLSGFISGLRTAALAKTPEA